MTPNGVTMPATDAGAELLGRGIVADLELRYAAGPQRFHVETIRGVCARTASERGGWAIRLTSGSARPLSLELSIPDAAAAERGTEVFTLTVALKTGEGDVRHEVDGRPDRMGPNGVGHVSALDTGRGATFVAEGLTREGVRVTAIVRCQHVARESGADAG
jgi:hypothetical protein